MTVQARHDCRTCSHSNDSHDALLGCLYPNCMCGNKNPYINAQTLRKARERLNAQVYQSRPKRRQRGFWRPTLAILRWFLGSLAGAVLAGALLAGAALLALVLMLARGGQ